MTIISEDRTNVEGFGPRHLAAVDAYLNMERDYAVLETKYSVRAKAGKAPHILRVDYKIEFGRYVTEWIPIEHDHFAGCFAEMWWRTRSVFAMPRRADEALRLAQTGHLRETLGITVQVNKRPRRIVDYRLGDLTRRPATSAPAYLGGPR